MDPATAARLVELARLVANLARVGVVAEVDHAAARCRVQSGGVLTDWLPWLAHRAGDTRDWSPPTEGEQVLIVSPSGELAAGVVLVGIYSDDQPAPGDSPTLHRRTYPDGAAIDYDHASHTIALILPEGGVINIQATGNVHVTGDVIADGISLKHHVHVGVVPGPANTGEPVA